MRRTTILTLIVGALTVVLWGCSDRQPDPITNNPLFQFSQGQGVQTTTSVAVHSAANNFSSVVTNESANAAGTIQTSPGTLDATGDNTIYWQVAFNDGFTGWVSGVFLTPATGGGGRYHYAATNGLSTNDGSITAPWDLQTAFNGGNGQILAGDTVWIRGGVYNAGGTGKYSVASTLHGTASAYIVFRQYPGEQAILDDPTLNTASSQLVVRGTYLAFWGFALRNSNATRTSARPNTIYEQGDHNKYINLVIHDGGVAFLTEPPATNAEISGLIIYNNGYDGGSTDRGHGHALYLTNTAPSTVLARDNIMFNQFGFGVHAYTDVSGRHVDNTILKRNVSFNNGTIMSNVNSAAYNIMIGADSPGTGGTGDVADSNMTFWSYNPSNSFAEGINMQMGRAVVNPGTVQVTNNYIVGQGRGSAVLDVSDWASGSNFTNNEFLDCTINVATMTPVCGSSTATVVSVNDATRSGITWSNNLHTHDTTTNSWVLNATSMHFLTWKNSSNMNAPNELAALVAPTATKVFVWKTLYEVGRGNIVVYNWGNVGSVNIDLSSIVPAGAAFKIWNVYDLVNPVLTGTYSGTGTVPLTIGAITPPAPTGWTTVLPQSTGTAFNAYIVRIAPY